MPRLKYSNRYQNGIRKPIKRLNRRNIDRDRFFLFAALIGCLLWIMSVSPLRIYATKINLCASWLLGVAPNFLAGSAFTFWQAYAVKGKPLASVTYAVVLVTVAEVIQLYLPGYRFDKWDLVAGIIGAMVTMPILLWRLIHR